MKFPSFVTPHVRLSKHPASLLFSLLQVMSHSPLASPCARRGTPEVRLWLSVFVSSMSCPFAFGKPVRPPWNARGEPLAVLPSMSCPVAFGKPVRPPWNARGEPLAVCVCLFASMSCLLPLASPCARRGTPEVSPWLSVSVSFASMSCPFAFGKPVRPPWNARGEPLAVCVCFFCFHVMSFCLWQARAPGVERPR